MKEVRNPKMGTKRYALLIACTVLCMNSCGHENETPPVNPIDAPAGTEIPVSVMSPTISYQSIGNERPVNNVQITDKNVTAAVEIERTLALPYDEKKLDAGVYYKMVIYENNGKNHTFKESKDFVAGDSPEIKLNKSQKYKIIVYSLGTKVVAPDLVDRNNFDQARVDIDFSKNKAKDLFYQSIEFVPDGQKKININLKQKITTVQLVLDTSDFYGGSNAGRITKLEDVSLVYTKYEKAALRISSNSINYSNSDITALDSNELGFNDANNTRESKWHNLILDPNKEVSFNAMIDVDGEDLPIPYKINIGNIKWGVSQIIKLKLEKCGLMLSTSADGRNPIWRQFMCHDIGADYKADPFEPSKKLHGAKYMWGDAYHISASDDQSESNKRTIPTWNEHDEYVVLGDTWSSDSKRNPCPDGYRVPSKAELVDLSKNEFKTVGNTSSDADLYRRGFELKDRTKGRLFLPKSGLRANVAGYLMELGETVHLWSGNEELGHDERAYSFSIGRGDTPVVSENKRTGLPVRCIKRTN